MKKALIIIFFSKLFITNTFSQIALDSNLVIFYKVSHLRDTLNSNSMHLETMALITNGIKSIYKDYSLERNDSLLKLQMSKNIMFSDQKIQTPRMNNHNRNEVIKNYSTQVLESNEYLLSNYVYEEKMESINWKIFDNKKNILGFDCQKASATIRGRNYIVWYSIDIPIADGPWKLYGLPGLILEANDEKNEVKFELQRIVKESGSKKLSFYKVGESIKTTKTSFLKLKKAYRANPQEYLSKQFDNGGSGTDVKLSFPTGFKFKTINNPIDLTENY